MNTVVDDISFKMSIYCLERVSATFLTPYTAIF